MDEQLLVATHLSSLNLTPASTIIVQTSRRNAPLPSNTQENDLPTEHATSSFVLSTPTTGTVLLRLLHGGLIIELVSLTTQVAPIRFVFPAVILPSPSLFVWEESELHLLAITDIGSLHRLIIPIQGLKLWQGQTDSIWPREYLIQNIPSDYANGCVVHAQGTHCVAISLQNGVLLRLEAESMGYDGHDEEWAETIFHHGSFLSSLTALLPRHSTPPNASDIISFGSHPWPTDIGNIWSLSRDRTLRLWKPKFGCVASKTLPITPNNRDPSNSTSNNAKYVLLDAEPQNLLKIFSLASQDEDVMNVYALVFIATTSSNSGGFFCFIDASCESLTEVGVIECPKHTTHCRLQDFVVKGNTLFTLWDRQGQSMVERTEINISRLRSHDLQPSTWKTSYYAQEPELTPAYMEEQLLAAGSLTEKFLEAIMKPGVFSSLTLRTALDKYVDACLSLPGPPPPQLLHTYATLCENIAGVVGCTVTLNRDPQTGGLRHANYWTALRRDWEGFVARCRDVERNARWPLVIGSHGDGVVVVERERVGTLVVEDVPTCLRRMLERDQPLHQQYNLLAIIWESRSKLGPRMMSSLEDRAIDIMHQEIAFPFAEILHDQARRIQFKDGLEEGVVDWVVGRLHSCDIDAATRIALDSIGGFEMAIKREETDPQLLTFTPASEWLRSQAASYTATTIEARYDLCLCLIILLFFLSEELGEWDASLLAEVFAVFRGVAMLRFVSRQPAEAHGASDRLIISSPDDVAVQMRNMNVSNSKFQAPSSSLIQLLIPQPSATDAISSTAHNFLDSTGLLQSLSPAHATKYEIMFCDRLRSLGFCDVARELLSWLPRTPATTFLQSQVWLKLGRVDDASQLLENLAGCFGVSNLTFEDSDALNSILPNSQPIDSLYSFYLFAAELFRNSFVHHEVLFSQLAIQVAPPGADTSRLWNTVAAGLTDLALYEDAYASVMAMPYEKQKRECASQLAIRMCEENAVGKLMAFDFAGVASEVEASLSFKARNADPRVRPCYSRILYTWYTRRGDYRNASLTMYHRARKLQDIITDATSFVSLAEDQVEALSVATNSLCLADEKTAWILMPVIPDLARKRQKLSKHIPEAKYISSKYDAEIVHLADMEYDCTLLRAQIDSIKREPALLSSPEYLLPPAVIVMRLAQANNYNQAMATARSLKIDMTDVFIHLTNQCVRLSRNPGSILQEDTSGWLLTDNSTSWQGSPSDRGWRYLQQSLNRHDSMETNRCYAKASLETILSVDGSLSPPPWLIDILEQYQPEYLIRISLRYENIEDAVNYGLALIRKSEKKLARDPSKNASTSWMPYALLDQVLVAADGQMNPPPHLTELKTAINNRVKSMQKSSQKAP
ncbi:nucleoporin Nup120/160-domain-containing protein [Crassisporium funariophilum]|nr:nucleoporin Nup120/160-domain-containing protein [Crassisporium funariophilum]